MPPPRILTFSGAFILAAFLIVATCANLARADYKLENGQTKTFTSADEFGDLSQNVTGPATGSATVILNITKDINDPPISGAFTGNLTLKNINYGQIRFCHDYATNGETPFSGPVTISSGLLYVRYGQELGTGTITLAGGGLSNGGGGWKNPINVTMTNALVFQTNTTSYVRFSSGGGNINLTENITGTGASTWGMTNGWYREAYPSVVTLSGDTSGYSGKVVFDHNYDANKKVAQYVVSNTNGFGTGVVEVNKPTEIDYTTAATVNHTSLTVASGQTLALKNSGGNAVSINTPVTNNGTITLTQGRVSLVQNLTGTGSLVVNSGATLGIGTYDATTGTTLTLTETGSFTLNGGLAIDLFSPTDYNTLVLNPNVTNTIGTDTWLEITVQNPEEFSNKLVAVKPIQNIAAEALENLSLRFMTDGFSGYIQNGQLYVGDRNALPEPATWVLLILGVGLMSVKKRKI